MKVKTLFLSGALLLMLHFTTSGQVRKEITTVKIDMKPDTISNYKVPQKSTTYGFVTVEGKRINYEAVAGTLVLKNKEDSPTISMSYIAYFKSDDKEAD